MVAKMDQRDKRQTDIFMQIRTNCSLSIQIEREINLFPGFLLFLGQTDLTSDF